MDNPKCTGKLKHIKRDELRRHTFYVCLECGAELTVTDHYREALPLPTKHIRKDDKITPLRKQG